jgi:Ser/Thr protein kinase RdoA (MazF antagonist)
VVWLVAARDGARYVLLRVPAVDQLGQRRGRLEHERRVLAHLHAAGVPVAVPVDTDRGERYVDDGDHLYLLAPALPSDASTPTTCTNPPRAYTQLGAAIARLHRGLRSYPAPFPSWTFDLADRTFADAVPGIEAALPARHAGPVLSTVDALRPALAGAVSGLPKQRIHGDCHLGNILFVDGAVSGFVDLDHLPLGPRVYDLAYLLAGQLVPLLDQPDPSRPWAAGFLDGAAHLVRGYHREYPLSAAERAAIAPAMAAVELIFVDWFLRHEPDPDGVARSLATLDWVTANLAALRTATTGAENSTAGR